MPWLVFGLILNATGAIGDLYMIVRLALVPGGILIEDWGDGISWFGPISTATGKNIEPSNGQ